MIMPSIMSTAYFQARAGAVAFTIACVLTIGTAPARAADLVDNQQSPEPPAVYPVAGTYLWNGPYIGVYGGYKSLNADISSRPDVNSVDGLAGGVYGGYNYQFNQNWVGGLEGTFGLSGADDAFGGTSVDQDWEASLRARMGYAFSNSMIYGLAGVAGSDVNASTVNGKDSNLLLGWQIGAGLETFLTQNVTGRVEYDYTDYAARSYSLGASGSPDIGLAGHTIKIGVGFKF
jgi:outer membrane immunogenic protein